MNPKKSKMKRFKKRRAAKVKNHSIQMKAPVEEEDWEKELEELSQHIEEQKQTPYDPVEDLVTDQQEMSFWTFENGLRSGQEQCIPSVHHLQPVSWIRKVYVTVEDQFADAED